jgi:hypothetical protein
MTLFQSHRTPGSGLVELFFRFTAMDVSGNGAANSGCRPALKSGGFSSHEEIAGAEKEMVLGP